MIEIMAIITKD